MERNVSREGQWEGPFEVRPQDRQRWSRQTAALHSPLQRQSAASSRPGPGVCPEEPRGDPETWTGGWAPVSPRPRLPALQHSLSVLDSTWAAAGAVKLGRDGAAQLRLGKRQLCLLPLRQCHKGPKQRILCSHLCGDRLKRGRRPQSGFSSHNIPLACHS